MTMRTAIGAFAALLTGLVAFTPSASAGDPATGFDDTLVAGSLSAPLRFGGTATFEPGKTLTAKDAPSPAGCP